MFGHLDMYFAFYFSIIACFTYFTFGQHDSLLVSILLFVPVGSLFDKLIEQVVDCKGY